jgi:hypothetical protein
MRNILIYGLISSKFEIERDKCKKLKPFIFLELMKNMIVIFGVTNVYARSIKKITKLRF